MNDDRIAVVAKNDPLFPVVVKAVKGTALHDEKTHKFSVPSLALKLTQTLRRGR